MYRFVFIDDEDFIRELFATVLHWPDYGFALAAAFSNAEETLGYLRENRVDVVLSDIKLGGMSGLELVETVKRLYPSTLIVLISGYRDFEYAFQAIKINVFDYILKPITQTQIINLFGALKETLDHRESHSQGIEQAYYDSVISLSKQYIRDNLGNNMSLDAIAEYVHMSPTYFSRYFKKQTGKKLVEYITGQRVEKSIELMRNPTLKICDIGTRVGYKNLQHFYNVFKSAMGCTPSEYRKKHFGEGHDEEHLG